MGIQLDFFGKHEPNITNRNSSVLAVFQTSATRYAYLCAFVSRRFSRKSPKNAVKRKFALGMQKLQTPLILLQRLRQIFLSPLCNKFDRLTLDPITYGSLGLFVLVHLKLKIFHLLVASPLLLPLRVVRSKPTKLLTISASRPALWPVNRCRRWCTLRSWLVSRARRTPLRRCPARLHP
jgi:hypothetical protein